MFSVKEIIYSFFGNYFNEKDSNKDSNGKGTLERYNEIVGEDIDDVIIQHIEDMVKDNLDPQEMLSQFLSLRESSLGIDLTYFSTEKWRRKTIKYFPKWVRMKGTREGLDLMFGILGITVNSVTLSTSTFSFDDTNFDNPDRVFDMNCNNCVEYELALGNIGTLTPELKRAIENIIQFNQPINAKLLTWQGSFDNSFNLSFN